MTKHEKNYLKFMKLVIGHRLSVWRGQVLPVLRNGTIVSWYLQHDCPVWAFRSRQDVLTFRNEVGRVKLCKLLQDIAPEEDYDDE